MPCNLCRGGKGDCPSCELRFSNKQTELLINFRLARFLQVKVYIPGDMIPFFTHCSTSYIWQLRKYGVRIYADLENYDNPIDLFHSFRLDIVMVKEDKIFILGLTCCLETHCEKSRDFKINKYEIIQNDCKKKFRHWKKIFILYICRPQFYYYYC